MVSSWIDEVQAILFLDIHDEDSFAKRTDTEDVMLFQLKYLGLIVLRIVSADLQDPIQTQIPSVDHFDPQSFLRVLKLE